MQRRTCTHLIAYPLRLCSGNNNELSDSHMHGGNFKACCEFILLSPLSMSIIIDGCVYLIYSDRTLTKSTPSVPNPLDAYHDLGKTGSCQQPEVHFATVTIRSDIGNKKPHAPHLYSSLEPIPLKVRYNGNSDSVHTVCMFVCLYICTYIIH